MRAIAHAAWFLGAITTRIGQALLFCAQHAFAAGCGMCIWADRHLQKESKP